MEVKKNKSESWYRKLLRTLNSALCFSLAYMLFNYVYWFAMAFAAKHFKSDAFVYYYGVKILLTSSQWDKATVTLIYSAGPVACLAAGLLFLFLYRLFRQAPLLSNVFLLWGFVIGTGMFLAQGLLILLGVHNYGSPYYQGLAVVLSWWRIPLFGARLLFIPFAMLFFYFSLNYGKPFLLFSFSYSRVSKLTLKRNYFFEVALVPFALGALISSLLAYPMNIPVNSINLFTIGAALAVAWYTLSAAPVMRSELLRYETLQTPSIVSMVLFVIVCVLVLAIYRGVYVGA